MPLSKGSPPTADRDFDLQYFKKFVATPPFTKKESDRYNEEVVRFRDGRSDPESWVSAAGRWLQQVKKR